MNRRTLLTRLASLGSVAASVRVEAAARVGRRRLDVLMFDGPESWDWFVLAIRTELSALGWVEGKNLSVQWHYAKGDGVRLRTLAAQIVASAPDVILTRGTPATHALQGETRTIPIATGVGDPVGSGFANTYAVPGGNITGLSFAIVEASEKFVELLRLLMPGLAHLIVVWSADRGPSLIERMRPVERAGRIAGVAVSSVLVADPAQLKQALQRDRSSASTAALIFGLGPAVPYELVASTALSTGMPTMFEYREYVDAGGLASFRFDLDNQNRRAAAQLDKLLRGEPAGKIPFELPTGQQFVLNLKSARALGLVVPRSVLLRADALIE